MYSNMEKICKDLIRVLESSYDLNMDSRDSRDVLLLILAPREQSGLKRASNMRTDLRSIVYHVARKTDKLDQLVKEALELATTKTTKNKLTKILNRLNSEQRQNVPSHMQSPRSTDERVPERDPSPEIEGTDERAKPTIGIITALPKEYIAVKAMLDNQKMCVVPGKGAGRRYLLGEVPSVYGRKHSVVLSLADMGNNIASNRATLLLEHFSHINSIIMVGIAGGIPHPEKAEEHVRLGDVVVSNQKGVIQYDFDKEISSKEIIHRHSPRPPSATLLEGVKFLKIGEMEGNRPWLEFITQLLAQRGITRPSEESDILVDSTDPETTIPHPKDPKRVKGEPRVFIAPIASANKLLKNPIKRDELRGKFGAKAVEMEGSGIADATWNHGVGYLVVRGICDYCDSKKGDDWQEYAAIIAAAYTRALLESMPS
ncbi:MAG: 5'-methylthioadenosine/S-adenosylhomocysteine nucleosidase [Ardenticatenaceae bacterium]